MQSYRLGCLLFCAAAALTVAAAQEQPLGQNIFVTALVPADAVVEINGVRMHTPGERRQYETPMLRVGQSYNYTFRVTAQGKTVTKTVQVQSGANNTFDFRPEFQAGAGAGGGGAALTEEQAFAIGTEAYVFGYPLITMEMTRRVMTNTPAPEGTKAPMGQFASLHRYPDATFKDVTAPNADTLYSSAWLDLAKEPWILHVPDENDRYYLMPMLDAWTNVFASPGKRTTGTGAGDFAITGPNWNGALPEGVKQLPSPTNMVWILGRTYCTGTPEDYTAVHKLQDQYKLTPLSAWGKPYTPPAKVAVDPSVDVKMPPREQVNRMNAATYFKLLAALMKDNPPSDADAPMVAKLAKLGIIPGQEFDLAKLDPAVARGLDRATKAGLDKILVETEHPGKKVNGWQFTFTGTYGTEYVFRAAVTYVGLGANLAQDACYPMTTVDNNGQRLSGTNKYVIRFANKDALPPVNGFWSLTMYDANFFFVANALNRYTLSQRNDLKANADGSIDLYIQKDNPGPDKEANWLPAPDGEFALMLRLYWPKESFLDGTWQPPAVQRVGQGSAQAAPVGSLEQVAEEAFIYGFPMVMNYGTLYEYFVDKSSPQYKCPFNQIYNTARVFTPKDTAIVTPNSDTPYSFVGADLRAEPIVLSVPEVEKGRYYSVQMIDMYTFNYGYIGSRTTGNGAGAYMIAGPNWKGETPPGIKKVFRCETDFSLVGYRTQLFGPADLDNVKKVQAGYKVQTLSAFLNQAPPPAAPEIAWPKIDKQMAAADPFAYLSFVLQFCPPTGPAAVDKPLRARFATIGIEAGKPFPGDKLTAEQKMELESGIKRGMEKIKQRVEAVGKDVNGWRVAQLALSRADEKGDWTLRAAVAMAGIYANDAVEALYPMLATDSEGNKPDCSKNRYTLTFPAGQLPPANAFWSITMYDGKTQLLIDNPLNRYLINAPMLPDLQKNADGSLTVYIQKDSPGKDKESNWLPAPDGPVYLVMRLYWPKTEALEGAWQPPAVTRVAK